MADRVTGIQVDFGLNSQGAPSSLFQAAQQSALPIPLCIRPLMVIQSADATDTSTLTGFIEEEILHLY